jgi:hypothetical protein
MTVEADIFTILAPLVGNRVFPVVAPFNTPRPYVTFQQIGGQPLVFLGREVPSKKNGLFQINVWADTRAEAISVQMHIDQVMRAATVFRAEPVSEPIAHYDQDIERRGTSQDFSIWSDR